MSPERVQIGPHELWCGDCREVLPMLGRVDAVITDPPYGLGRDGWDDGKTNVELAAWAREWLSVAPYAMFTFHARVWELGSALAGVCEIWRVLVWHKPFVLAGNLANFKWHWEPIVWIGPLGKKPPGKPWVVPDVFTIFPVASRVHPESIGHNSQKPEQLMRDLLSPQADAKHVLDPFMGSGTTGVACVQLGRKFTGIERERKYFDIACQRIERAMAQAQLFPPEEVRAAEQTTIFQEAA